MDVSHELYEKSLIFHRELSKIGELYKNNKPIPLLTLKHGDNSIYGILQLVIL